MPTTATVSVTDLATALGQVPPVTNSVTEKQWNMWINDADMLIDDRMVELGIAEPLPEIKRKYVVREAVVAHIKKPDDATQVTIAVDDASTSKSYRSGKGRVVILDEWWTLLGLTDAAGAFAIDTVSFVSNHAPTCSLAFGALYCSCGASIAGFPLFGGAA